MNGMPGYVYVAILSVGLSLYFRQVVILPVAAEVKKVAVKVEHAVTHPVELFKRKKGASDEHISEHIAGDSDGVGGDFGSGESGADDEPR